MAENKTEQGKKPWTAKRILAWVGIGFDIAATVFLLIVSIILLVQIPNRNSMGNQKGFMGMIAFFMDQNRNGPTVFLCTVVIPLFILLVLNIVLTVTYYQREAAKERAEAEKAKEEAKKPSLDNLSKDQLNALLEQFSKEAKDKKDKEEKEEKK